MALRCVQYYSKVPGFWGVQKYLLTTIVLRNGLSKSSNTCLTTCTCGGFRPGRVESAPMNEFVFGVFVGKQVLV